MIVDDFEIANDFEETEPVSTRTSRNSLISLAQKSGWLKKRTNSSAKNWSFRYFVLVNQKLYYYRQPSDRIPCGILNFNQISYDLQARPTTAPEILTIVAINSTYAMQIRSKNSSDMIEWTSALTGAIMSSKGKAQDLSSRASIPKFWKCERTSPKELLETIDTGDLILFRVLEPKTQNRFKYVHVSFIIKYPNNDIGIMDANSIDGISILLFEEFTENYKPMPNSEIVYRQLIADRGEELFLKVDEFIKKVDRNKFNLPPIKLLQKSNFDNFDEETAAFGSELVASAYKAMGFLGSDIPASLYSPQDFGHEKRLNLIGARLTPGVLVDFKQD